MISRILFPFLPWPFFLCLCLSLTLFTCDVILWPPFLVLVLDPVFLCWNYWNFATLAFSLRKRYIRAVTLVVFQKLQNCGFQDAVYRVYMDGMQAIFVTVMIMGSRTRTIPIWWLVMIRMLTILVIVGEHYTNTHMWGAHTTSVHSHKHACTCK